MLCGQLGGRHVLTIALRAQPVAARSVAMLQLDDTQCVVDLRAHRACGVALTELGVHVCVLRLCDVVLHYSRHGLVQPASIGSDPRFHVIYICLMLSNLPLRKKIEFHKTYICFGQKIE